MPFVRDKNLVNIYEEIDKANSTIKTLSTALRDEEENNSILKKHRIILGVAALVMLILFLWSFLPKSKQYKQEYLIKNNLSLIDTDSLHKIQRKAKQVILIDSVKTSLIDMSIVYSIQIGAYTNFSSNLISDDITLFSRITPDVIEGSSPQLLTDFMEVRGLGVVNVRAMFGANALKRSMRGIGIFACKALVDDAVVAEAEMMCSAQDRD